MNPSSAASVSRVPSGMVEPCVSSALRPMGTGRQSIETPWISAAARATRTAAGTISCPMSSPLRMPILNGVIFLQLSFLMMRSGGPQQVHEFLDGAELLEVRDDVDDLVGL